jgi:hypothetical protein
MPAMDISQISSEKYLQSEDVMARPGSEFIEARRLSAITA